MRRLLIDVTPVIEALELTTKSLLGGQLIGSYKSRFKGKGIEFDGYSEYNPNEDADMIDWRASTRANKLLTREYSEERNLNILFLVDVSNSMIYTTGKKLKAEYAGELVISLSFLMLRTSDQVGFALFSDKIIKEHAPQAGLTEYYRIIDTLLDSQNYGGGYDLDKGLEFAFTYMKPGSMIILVTDFIGLKPNWQERLRVNSRRFDIITFMIRDPADSIMPKSTRGVILKDPFSNKRIHIHGEKAREKYSEYVKQQEKSIEEFFTRLGISFLRLDTSKSFVEPVIKFFKARKSKWK